MAFPCNVFLKLASIFMETFYSKINVVCSSVLYWCNFKCPFSVSDTSTKPAKRPKCAKGYHVSKNAYTLVYTLQGHKGVGKAALNNNIFILILRGLKI